MSKCFSGSNLLLDICIRTQIGEILKVPSDEIKNGRSDAPAAEQKGTGKLGGRWGIQNIRTGT
jgi:hypothetical protein